MSKNVTYFMHTLVKPLQGVPDGHGGFMEVTELRVNAPCGLMFEQAAKLEQAYLKAMDALRQSLTQEQMKAIEDEEAKLEAEALARKNAGEYEVADDDAVQDDVDDTTVNAQVAFTLRTMMSHDVNMEGCLKAMRMVLTYVATGYNYRSVELVGTSIPFTKAMLDDPTKLGYRDMMLLMGKYIHFFAATSQR